MSAATRVDSSRCIGSRWGGVAALTGIAAAAICVATAPHAARGAAEQAWPPFVLVAGLLLVGAVAAEDGIFAAVGARLAGLSRNGVVTYFGAMAAITVVTAILNLDTAVVFLTPVLVATAQGRGSGVAPFLYASIFMANASSLFLPGSNLTNLIVLSRHGQSGGSFVALMAPAAIGATVVTAVGLAVWARRQLFVDRAVSVPAARFTLGLGAAGVLAAAVLSVAVSSPALPVAAVGVAMTTIRLWQRKRHIRQAVAPLGGPALLGLFGLAVAMGTIGRVWTFLPHLVAQAGGIGTTVLAALAAILFNNLPAASLLAAHRPAHPAQLLVGLNIGPNLFVTGSLAWFLWFRVARSSGADPSLRQATKLGLVLAPLGMVAALGCLALA